MNDEDDEEVEPFVCHGCIGDEVLSAEIKEEGKERECNYCGADAEATVSISWLGKRVDDVYRALVGEAEAMPVVMSNDNVHWIPDGQSPSEILGEMIEAAHAEIADAIIEELGSAHAWGIQDGDYDYYDSAEDKYALRKPNDPRYSDLWTSFCESLKHSRRFFSDDAEGMLDQILGPILRGENNAYGVAIKTIGAENDGRLIYRARVAHEDAARQAIYASPIKQLGAPPPAQCVAGRMNVTGIPVFYGSFDSTTCVAETRVPVGGSAIVGKFEIMRTVRLLDLTQLGKIQIKLSYFHPDYFDAHAYNSFLQGFHAEIKKPVLPGQEALEYLPTQVVAEYLWTRSEFRVDGIIFGSAQMSGDHSNIVLFPHALAIEGAEEEKARDIVQLWVRGSGDPDDTEPPVHAVSYRKTLTQTVPPPSSNHRFPWFMETLKPPVAPEPTLRFNGSLSLTSVTAINVEVSEALVEFIEHDDHPDF